MTSPASFGLLAGAESLIDVLDRVIDKGVQVDGRAAARLLTFDPADPHSGLSVTGLETRLTHCELPVVGGAVTHSPTIPSRTRFDD